MAAGYYQCECVPVLLQYGSDINLVKGDRYTSACPVNGDWSSWGSWSTWNGTCDSDNRLIRHRSRLCSSPPPVFGGLACNGSSEKNQTKNCDSEESESINETTKDSSHVSTTPKTTTTKTSIPKIKTTTKPKTTSKTKTVPKNKDISNSKSAAKIASTFNSGSVPSVIGTKINIFMISVILVFCIE